MIAPAIIAQAAVEPRSRRTYRARREEQPSPAEAAFSSFLADPRLTPFDKLLLTLLGSHCLAHGNAFCWPSSGELARRAGADGVADGGEARVNRSLVKMERLGILERIAWYELDEFMTEVGRPRLGLADPRERAESPRRFLLLWWRVPGLSERFSVAVPERKPVIARTRVDARVHDSSACHYRAPSTAGDRTPAPALRTGSKLELSKSNIEEKKFADARRRPEADPPKPEPAPVPDGPIAAAAPDGLSAGQLEALAALTPARRARLDQWSPRRRADFLEPLARGFEPKILRMLEAELDVAAPAPMPGPSVPTPQLIAALAGPYGPSLAPRTADAIMSELADPGGGDSFGFWHNACAEIVNGRRPVESLLRPFERTLEAMGRGEPIDNPARYCVRGVANWVREHPPS